MLSVKNGVIELSKTRKITPKQAAKLKLMGERTKTNYLLSLMGLSKQKVYGMPCLKSAGPDSLAKKSINTVLIKLRRLRDVNDDHYPDDTNLGSWIGVEIECFIPHQDGDKDGECTDECDHDNGECFASQGRWSERDAHRWLSDKIKKAKISRVSVKGDGSLEDSEGHGVEVTIVFNSARGFEPLERLCQVLSSAGCYVNKTSGLHIHLDARHLEQRQVRTIGNSIGHALPVLKWMVPKSRHENRYCHLSVSGFKGDRYHAVNLTAFRKFKTIEVRLHSGSVSFSKIKNWIELLKVIGGSRLSNPVTTLQELIDATSINDQLIEYIEARITELNNEAWSVLNPEVLPPNAVEYSVWLC